MSAIAAINTNQTSSAANTTNSSSAGSSQTSLSSLGSTFLQLLTQELQNQDPTAPVDSTQMVGQMISLNQLDQLASINQLLTTVFGTSSTAGSAQGGASAQAKLATLQSALASSNNAAAATGLTSPGTSAL